MALQLFHHVPGSKSFASCPNTTDSGPLDNKNLSDRSFYGGAGIVALALVAVSSGNGGFCLAVVVSSPTRWLVSFPTHLPLRQVVDGEERSGSKGGKDQRRDLPPFSTFSH
jgi:hypothetical protein